MLGELSGAAKIYIITGRTDMRRSIDGLMAIIRDRYQMDPYENACISSAAGKATGLKLFILTGMALYSTISVLITAESFNGPGVHKR